MNKKSLRIVAIIGTRPEVIKMSPIIKECKKRKHEIIILHSGQHYSPDMDAIFFKQLKLPKPDYNLQAGNLPYSKQLAMMMRGITTTLKYVKPDVVLVQGDTMTVLCGALAANKLGIPIGHVEAGLRSYDLSMMEEINRTIVDNISDYLFCPTETAADNLIDEGIKKNIFVTGNTVVDTLYANVKNIEKGWKGSGLKKKGYILCTCHRAENVDNKERLKSIVDALNELSKTYLIVFPIHPRTLKRLSEFKITLSPRIDVHPPLGYFQFLAYEKNAKLLLSDSGGNCEEVSILKTPGVTLRNNTERPEVMMAGVNVLAGANTKMILKCVDEQLKKKMEWKQLYGDGTAAKKTLDFLEGVSSNIKR